MGIKMFGNRGWSVDEIVLRYHDAIIEIYKPEEDEVFHIKTKSKVSIMKKVVRQRLRGSQQNQDVVVLSQETLQLILNCQTVYAIQNHQKKQH